MGTARNASGDGQQQVVNTTFWNRSVKTIPHYVSTIKCVLSGYPVLSVRTNSTIILALQKKLLQVYYLTDNGYELIDAKSFELGEANVEQKERIDILGNSYEGWYRECLRINEVYSTKSVVYNLCGKTLFACGMASNILWSWCLPSSEVTSYYTVEENVRQVETQGGDIYVSFGFNNTQLLKYDKKSDRMLFLLSVPGTKSFIIGENIILAVPSPGDNCLKRMWIWKKGEYSSPARTRGVYSTHHSATIALHKYIVYSEDAQVKVWDPEPDVLLSSFHVGASIGFLKAGFSTAVVVFINSTLYVWDWKTGVRVCRLYNALEWTGDYRQLVWINPTMILAGGVNNQLEMLCFI